MATRIQPSERTSQKIHDLIHELGSQIFSAVAVAGAERVDLRSNSSVLITTLSGQLLRPLLER